MANEMCATKISDVYHGKGGGIACAKSVHQPKGYISHMMTTGITFFTEPVFNDSNRVRYVSILVRNRKAIFLG